MTHGPYAAWCQDCVAGETVEAAHRRLRREPAAASIISANYCFLGLTDKPEAERKEGDPDSVIVLVKVDSVSMCQQLRLRQSGYANFDAQFPNRRPTKGHLQA
jgi:hypothetical protein